MFKSPGIVYFTRNPGKKYYVETGLWPMDKSQVIHNGRKSNRIPFRFRLRPVHISPQKDHRFKCGKVDKYVDNF